MLFFDLETKSGVDLPNSTAWRYAAEAEITHIAYAIDDEDIKVVEKPTDEFIDAWHNHPIVAHNLDFDLAVATTVLNLPIPTKKLHCTKSMAAALNLPTRLKYICPYLGLGEKLEMDFSKQSEMIFDDNAPTMEQYAINDVLLLRKLYYKIFCMLDDREVDRIDAHLRINARGLPIDQHKLDKLIAKHQVHSDTITKDYMRLVGHPPTNVGKLKEYINSCAGYELLVAGNKKSLEPLKDNDDPRISESARMRLEFTNNELNKLIKMRECMWEGRLKGCYSHSAAITGRWSSRGVQMHNCKRGGDIKTAVAVNNNDTILYVSDYAQIELRVVLKLIGARGALISLDKGDLYMETARDIYGKDATKEHRRIAKQAILGMLYGCSERKLSAITGAPSSEAADIYAGVHKKMPTLKAFSTQLLDCLTDSIKTGAPKVCGKVKFRKFGEHVAMKIPTGRIIWYRNAKMAGGGIMFGAANASTGGAINHAGSVLEHVCSGVARDIMADALVRFQQKGIAVIGHIHDEIIAEVNVGADTKELDSLMLPNKHPVPLAVESEMKSVWS